MRHFFPLALLFGLACASTSKAAVIQNPGFELNASSFTVFPGYTFQNGNTTIADWTTVNNNTGINPGTFGSTPFGPASGADVGNFAFLQGNGAEISQTLTGLVVGAPYTVSYDDSTRNGNTGDLTAAVGAVSNLTVPSTQSWTGESFSFLATATSMTLSFTNTSPTGDNTVNVDQLRIVPEPSAFILGGLGLAGLVAAVRRRRG